MILGKKIIGKNINLRTAEPKDAEFILSLRLNNNLNRYIKGTDPSVENQRKYILGKQKKENDYHLIIESKNNQNYGVIALYDIEDGKFDWGRWLIIPKVHLIVSLESIILLYNFAFMNLNLKKTEFEVRNENKNVIKFHQNYGAKLYSSDETFSYFRYTKEQYYIGSNFINKWKEFFIKK